MEPSQETAYRGGKGKRIWQFLIRELRKNTAVLVSLGVRGAAVVAGFAVTYLIGHNLGPAATGQYALITQTALFLAIVGLLGLDVSVVRHFARSVAQGSRLAFGSLIRVTWTSLGLMVAIAAVMWLGGEIVWGWLFADAAPPEMLIVLCVLIVGRGGTRLFGALLRSQHMFALGQVVPALIIPAVTAIALAFGLVDSVEGALWATAVGGIFALLVGALFVFGKSSAKSDAVSISMRAVFASSLPLWGVGIAQNIADWYGLAVAAQMLGAADAGLYRASMQIAAVLQVATIALFSVYSAKISTAFHAQDKQEAASLAAAAVRFSALLVIPAGLVLALGGGFLLGQIGPEFAVAYPVLVVLVVGQVMVALTGPCGLVLAMAGHEKINLTITLVSTTLLLVLVPVFAHFWGLMGLAICISVATLGRNLAAYFLVYRLEGIQVWRGKVRAET